MAVSLSRCCYIALVCGGLLLGGVFLAGIIQNLGCSNHQFINNDFACGSKHTIDKGDYLTLKNDISELIAARQRLGEISYAAIYFRDLRAGPTFGINDSDTYSPASLLKLPVALAYFNYEEEYPGVLERKLLYSTAGVEYLQQGLHQIDEVKPPLIEGQQYTIRELLKAALVYSDNLAFFLAVDYFNKNIPDGGTRLLEIFHELGIYDPRSPDDESITVRNYAGLYRQLYNVSYLSPTHSEEVLAWLSDSTFDKGLEAGVPTEVKVAHKFGERGTAEGAYQLHDCGIVYFPNNPYLLCIMTKGSDWENMADFISTISKMVYNEIDARRL
jgi:beta-lactamase class A